MIEASPQGLTDSSPLTHGLPRVIEGPLELTPDIIRSLPGGVGVVLNLVDSSGAILMSDHKATRKHPRRAWGPNSETLHWSDTRVEKSLHAVKRCLREELEIDDPDTLGLQTSGSLTLSWCERPPRPILTITHSLFVPDEARERLLAPKSPDNPEIIVAKFMTAAEALSGYELRTGTRDWLAHLGQLGLLGRPVTESPAVSFPSITLDGHMQDSDFPLGHRE